MEGRSINPSRSFDQDEDDFQSNYYIIIILKIILFLNIIFGFQEIVDKDYFNI